MNDVEHNMFRHIEQEQHELSRTQYVSSFKEQEQIELCRTQYVSSYRTRTK